MSLFSGLTGLRSFWRAEIVVGHHNLDDDHLSGARKGAWFLLLVCVMPSRLLHRSSSGSSEGKVLVFDRLLSGTTK